MIDKLPETSIIRTTWLDWVANHNDRANIVEFQDGTNIHYDRGYSLLDVNGTGIGVGVSVTPGHDNTMMGFLIKNIEDRLRVILQK